MALNVHRRVGTAAALALAGALTLLAPVAVPAAPRPAPTPAASAAPAGEYARSLVDAMFRTGRAEPSWFTTAFLARTPIERVDEAIASVERTLSGYRTVTVQPGKLVAQFANGTDDVLLHVDADSKIDAIVFLPAVPITTLGEALHALETTTGTVSFVLTDERGNERASINATESLAVASAFKLAVIDALVDAIGENGRHWSDVVPLDPAWKSLPGGVLQTWPDGTPLTLATYATEMIAISDNTAADALIHILGQGGLRHYSGTNDPMLTTRQMFTLRSTSSGTLHGDYLAADGPKNRATVLERVDAVPLPAQSQVLQQPDLTIEWHYDVRTLCKMMEHVADLPLMSINPGVADRNAFAHVAFKGGSDDGVLNLTTAVTTKRGTKFCFSATLNDGARTPDAPSFQSAYRAVLAALASQ